jgi:hypothetical protein
LIGSAKRMLTPDQGFGKREKRHHPLHGNLAAVHP